MNAATILRAARRQAGLTQAALAARGNTAQSAIAAYETGVKQPSLPTLDRLVAAAGLSLRWSLATRDSVLAAAVGDIADALHRDDEAEALRHAATLHGALAPRPQLEAVISSDPGSTGDHRWDALVAGLVERAAHRAGLRTPVWTAAPERFLETWWFVSPHRSLHASALVHAPAELANRGVFVHADSLESV